VDLASKTTYDAPNNYSQKRINPGPTNQAVKPCPKSLEIRKTKKANAENQPCFGEHASQTLSRRMVLNHVMCASVGGLLDWAQFMQT
jgi:hypothetical protein